MLDINYIRDNVDTIKNAIKLKNCKIDLDELLELDDKRRSYLKDIEDLRSIRNKKSKEISTIQSDERQKLIDEVKDLKTKLESLEKDYNEIINNYTKIMLFIPSPPHKEVPEGMSENDNVEIRKWGKIPQFPFKIKSHDKLAENLDLADFTRGAKVSGSKFLYLKKAGALLELAILRHTLLKLINRGFTPIIPPVLVRYDAMMGTGYFPVGIEEAYHVTKDELFLIGTSEVPLCALHQNEILDKDILPIKYCGYSNCFRREAGAHGKDTHGFYRLHQFQKIEQVVICENDPDVSMQIHNELLSNSEEVVRDLELPYRVVAVCGGEMGLGQVLKHDIEVFMPSRNAYGETHSCSTFYDFQARRLNLRYRHSEGKIEFCHTLNNTAIASPRILIALLELNQNEDGSVNVPKVLQPYMNGIEVIR